MSEDLKPRGEKPQWWLAVRPSVLAEALDAEARGSRLVDMLDLYQRALLRGSSSEVMYEDTQMLVSDLMHVEEIQGLKRLAADARRGLPTVDNPRLGFWFGDNVARVFQYGADKYSAGNFRAAFHDPDSMRREYFSAIMRHLLAFWTGEELDPESGLPHTAHALCGALMLLEMEKGLVK